MQDERLSADDLAYFQAVQQQLQAAQAAWQSFSAHLVQKYGLSATDGLRPDGAIVRDGAAEDER